MLVLTRSPGESIHIGDDIEVVLLDSPRGNQRIGIVAPKEVPVHRSEVYERIQAQSDEVNGNK